MIAFTNQKQCAVYFFSTPSGFYYGFKSSVMISVKTTVDQRIFLAHIAIQEWWMPNL